MPRYELVNSDVFYRVTEFDCKRASMLLQLLAMATEEQKYAEWKKRFATEAARHAANARMTTISPERRKEIARIAAQARWAKTADATPPSTPTPKLRGKKASVSVKRRGAGIMLNPRPQLPLPLGITDAGSRDALAA